LSPAARARVNSAQRIITALDFEIDTFAALLARRLYRDPSNTVIQQIPGVGPVLAAVFLAEIGQVNRSPGAAQLTSWAG
jgi:transposase